MKIPFQIGDQKEYQITVTQEKLAEFESGVVHPVYSTFALGQDAEWCGRLFVLEMKEEGEEGIGAYLSIEHKNPAVLGSVVRIISTLTAVEGRTVITEYKAFCKDRLIAKGVQHQKIIQKARFEALLEQLKEEEA